MMCVCVWRGGGGGGVRMEFQTIEENDATV